MGSASSDLQVNDSGRQAPTWQPKEKQCPKTNSTHTVVAVGRGVEESAEQPSPQRDGALDALNVFAGRWINEGETVSADGAATMRIATSDVYDWAPGRFHIVHAAYGQLAGADVGGTEIMTHDADTGRYRTYFFDSQGNTSTHSQSVDGNTWRWQGDTTRCNAVFAEGGRVQTALHERTDDGGATWQPTMPVTLTKVA